MSPVHMLLFKHDGPEGPAPAFGREVEVPREIGQPELDVGDVLRQRGAVRVRGVVDLVVDAHAGGGAGGGEVVERDPGEDLVVGPGVGVGPVVEFLVDPGQEGGGAVGEGVAEGLGLGALDRVVAAAFLKEPVRSGEPRFFEVAVGRDGVSEC